MWGQIWDHLAKNQLTAPLCPIAVRLSIRDWNQVERGGSGGIPPGFVEQNELFPIPVAVD
ncbi:MAG: hypothetical protein ABS79_05155 [Planctomycetes bacterium SCN 63-9]|nr:MAG: hypothetical protein ABS79_05155 [Planctomycetes bacterium SCN 63-9]